MPSICVYCAASNHIDQAYFKAADQLGRLIAQRGDGLVYGGGSIGLMGEVARSVKKHGGKVTGIIPHMLVDKEFAFTQADELIYTDDMRSRKAIMDQRGDAFVILPGGFGTMEEMFEILVGRVLKYHNKPIVIVNIEGFYDPLLELMEHMYEHRFARSGTRELYRVVDDVLQVYDAIEAQRLPVMRETSSANADG